jgi:hypothetical protein
MQFLTELPFSLRRPNYSASTSQPESKSQSQSQSQAASPPSFEQPWSDTTVALKPIWPDYFARRGQRDALTWQYKGYWRDTARIWCLYYRFVARHPWIACSGLRQFYASLIYRVFGEAVGDRSMLLTVATTPLLAALTPPLAALAVCIASLRALKKRVPALFQPFNRRGWSNYCIMLSLVFSLHGYRQHQRKTHPTVLSRHSSKTFWNGFFRSALPDDQFPTRLEATCINHQFAGNLPQCDLVLKPDTAGAGHRLRMLRWDTSTDRYVNDYPDRQPGEPECFTQPELRAWLSQQPLSMIIERAERPRAPLPICTLRVLTLFAAPNPELICAVFIKAPANDFSTAFFDTDIYLINYSENRIGVPLAPDSKGEMTGRSLPEIRGIIDTCLKLHAKLPDHIQVSWDVIPTARGPVYLEGNVFPPGCDYKLTVFKENANFDLLTKKILGRPGLSYSGTELMR